MDIDQTEIRAACLRDEDAAAAEGLDAEELQRLFLQLA
jgi:hypothetical protein